jgi:hypothetical protein
LCSLGKEIEDTGSRKIVDREILHADLENPLENRRDDKHHEKRIQNTPQETQDGSSVLHLNIFDNQILKKISIA